MWHKATKVVPSPGFITFKNLIDSGGHTTTARPVARSMRWLVVLGSILLVVQLHNLLPLWIKLHARVVLSKDIFDSSSIKRSSRCEWNRYINRGKNGSSSYLVADDNEECLPLQIPRPIQPHSPPQSNTHQKAAICAVHAGEEHYIDEWVDYHLALGFDPIVVFDNSESFELQQWGTLKEQEEGPGRVLVYHGPGNGTQLMNYHKCLQKVSQLNQAAAAAENQISRRRIGWIMTLDLDEFLVLRHHSNVIDFLSQYLSLDDDDDSHAATNSNATGSIAVNWQLFAPPLLLTNQQQQQQQPNGQFLHYEAEPVTKRCTQRPLRTQQTFKAISKVSAVERLKIHNDKLKPGFVTRDLAGTVLGPQSQFTDDSSLEEPVAALHHYFFKSLEEYHVKACVRGRADVPSSLERCNVTLLWLVETFGKKHTIHDDTAWRKLKEAIPAYRRLEQDGTEFHPQEAYLA